MAQSAVAYPDGGLSREPSAGAIRERWVAVAVVAVLALGATAYLAPSGASAPSFCRIWTRARSGCAARSRPAPGQTEGVRVANQARVLLASFPEATIVTSQVGRPDDGTDTTGFFNTEYLRRPETEGAVAPGISPEQGSSSSPP